MKMKIRHFGALAVTSVWLREYYKMAVAFVYVLRDEMLVNPRVTKEKEKGESYENLM